MQPKTAPEGVDRSALEKAAKPEELGEVISYLAEKEASLSNYSDKLRESIVTLFNRFGDTEYCSNGLCSSGRNWLGHKRFRTTSGSMVYTNEPERIAGTTTSRNDGFEHEFKPKIALTLSINHTTKDKYGEIIINHFFIEGEDPTDTCYFLATRDGRLVIAEAQRRDPDSYIRATSAPAQLSRRALRALVKSGAIISFLQQYRDKLTAAAAEYNQVADVAEKLAAAVIGEAE